MMKLIFITIQTLIFALFLLNGKSIYLTIFGITLLIVSSLLIFILMKKNNKELNDFYYNLKQNKETSVNNKLLKKINNIFNKKMDVLNDKLYSYKEQLYVFKKATDAVDEALVLTDLEGKIVFLNRVSKELLLFKLENNLLEIIPELRDNSFFDNNKIRFEHNNNIYLIRQFELEKYNLYIFNDVTEIENIKQSKDMFIANATHELKTPLTSIIGFVDTLIYESSDNMNLKFLNIIKNNANRLYSIVNDLIKLSKLDYIKNNKIEYEYINLKDLVENILVVFDKELQKKRVTVVKNIDVVDIKTNRELFEHILINLIDNGIKYNVEGGKLFIRSFKNNKKLIIEIEDSGIGLRKEDMERIFNRFYVVDKSRTRETNGTGLGLSIVRDYVKKLGAEIVVDSVYGKYTIFSLEFKCEE